LNELTVHQKKAVETVDRNICVSAGAGTGKTRVLVERFLYLISNHLAKPAEVLAITFTEKAAQEMKSRIAKRLKEEGLEDARRQLENAYIGTIHSFCSRILREHPIEAGVDPAFRVLEEDEANLLKETALEDLIESRFQEPDVFNLLRIYSDQEIRQVLKHAAERAHAHGNSIQELATIDFLTSIPKITQDVLTALKPLQILKDKDSDCRELETALLKSVSNWNELESVKEIGKRFQRRGKIKDQIEQLRNILDRWIASQAEVLGEKFRKTFLNLANDFEQRYLILKQERSTLDFNDLERKALYLLSQDNPRSKACRNQFQKNFKFILVDEFQDTSPLQDKLISFLVRPDNLFIVGDWKQSIYGFRGSDASLLLRKETAFVKNGNGERISLVENFRSLPEVLNTINPFFESLFAQEGQFEQLKSKLSSADGSNPCVEFLAIERKEDETMNEVRMNEARILAERISQMIDSDRYDYKDFAMLFRATTDIYFYEYELRNYGIPYYVVGGRGFYKQPEIKDLISFLELLENPHLDIPLAAVLRSPLVQISDDSLFWLANYSRLLLPAKPLYEALIKFEEISELEEEDKTRLEKFRSFLFELLNEKEKSSISECIELILERTKYDRYVLHLPQGKRHFANIRKLLEVARELEAREPVHLGDFIRYVKGFETQEVRESEAQVEALEGNVVKLMTIHKAKGLEFKVVLLPDLNRRGEKRGSYFLTDPIDGVGFKVFNESTFQFEKTLTYLKIKEKIIQSARQEAKRLLYVAMTRAKDHLILSGSLKAEPETDSNAFDDGANWFEWVWQWAVSSGNLTPQIISAPEEKKGRHPLPLAEHKKIKTAMEQNQPIKVDVVEGVSQMIDFLKPIEPVYFERIDLPVSAYAVFDHDLEEYRRTYELGVLPEEKNDVIPAKAGIQKYGSSIETFGDDNKEKFEEWSETEDEEGETLSPADFGTVIHKIFEHLVTNPAKASGRLKFWLDRVQKNLNEATFEEVKKLSHQFLKSKQFLDIQSAKKRYPEVPFVLRLHHGIIQGTLDLLYQNSAGDWIILDYKTSQIALSVIPAKAGIHGSPVKTFGDDQELKYDLKSHADRYQGQMLLYALACQELLKITPRFATLYFVRIDQTFEFSLADLNFQNLRQQFETLQKKILDQRKNWMSHEPAQ